jgi:ligand-binding sensor domain-containing protein/signal transduction histidine kinase
MARGGGSIVARRATPNAERLVPPCGGRGRRRGFALALVLAVIPLPALAERLPIRTYTTLDGLVHDAVRAITQDGRGFLWLGTEAGLSRFDGYGFKNYGVADGLPGLFVRAVLESTDQRLWVATTGGLCAFDPETVTGTPACRRHRLGASEDSNSARALFEDPDHVLWVGTDDGLYAADLKAPAIVFRQQVLFAGKEAPRGVAVNAIRSDGKGGLWLATWAGVMRLRKDRHAALYPVTSSPAQDQRVFDVLPEPNGRLWIGDVARGVFVWQPPAEAASPPPGWSLLDASRHHPPPVSGQLCLPRAPGEVCLLTSRDGLGNDLVRQGLLRTSDGRIWIGTVLGLTLFDGARLRSFGTAEGLSDPAARPCFEDRQGNVWLGSTYGGVMRLAGEGFVTYTEADGLRGWNVRSILEARDGALYVESRGAELQDFIQRWDGNRFTAVTPGVAQMTGWGVGQIGFTDRGGAWWLPDVGGLARYPPQERLEALAGASPLKVYTQADGLGGGDVYSLYEDQNQDLWIGTWGPGYLTRWRRTTGRFERFGAAQGVPETPPAAYAEDASGTLWIGFASGELGRVRGSRVELLAPPLWRKPPGILSLHLGRRGELWVGTQEAGARRIEAITGSTLRITELTVASGLSDQSVSAIAEDEHGDLYFGTTKGVDRLEQPSGRFRHYSALDGLPNNSIVAMLRDRHGEIWFGTHHGLSRFFAGSPRSPRPPAVLVTSLVAAGTARAVPTRGTQAIAGLDLPGDRGDIQIEYVGLSFAPGERLRYEYRLEGAEQSWNAPTEERHVNYAHLAPGSYRFVVRALSAAGSASLHPASIAFTVLPPLWRRGWIQALAFLGVTGVALTLHRARVARLVAIERLRSRVAADLHDDLGASLSEIAIQSELLKQTLSSRDSEVASVLGQIAETSRSLIDVVSDAVWAIDPRRDDVRNLATRLRHFASGVLEPGGVHFELEIDDGAAAVALTSEQRRHLYLSLKEAVHNVARHAAARHAHLRLAVRRGDLLAELRDDGRGFAAGDNVDAAEAGNGLRNMRQRARSLGGELAIQAAPGQGVVLTLRVPLRGGGAPQWA